MSIQKTTDEAPANHRRERAFITLLAASVIGMIAGTRLAYEETGSVEANIDRIKMTKAADQAIVARLKVPTAPTAAFAQNPMLTLATSRCPDNGQICLANFREEAVLPTTGNLAAALQLQNRTLLTRAGEGLGVGLAFGVLALGLTSRRQPPGGSGPAMLDKHTPNFKMN